MATSVECRQEMCGDVHEATGEALRWCVAQYRGTVRLLISLKRGRKGGQRSVTDGNLATAC